MKSSQMLSCKYLGKQINWIFLCYIRKLWSYSCGGLLIFKCRNLCCSQNLISFLFCMINYDTWSVWFHKELRVMLDIFPNIGVNSIWLKGVYLRSEMGKAEFSKGFFSGLFSNICRVLKMWKWSRSVALQIDALLSEPPGKPGVLKTWVLSLANNFKSQFFQPPHLH